MKRRAVACLVASGLGALALLSGCSREKIDWKSAEAADTIEAYDHFIELHADGELAAQARARVAQLNEDRAWKRAIGADTPAAYRQFLAQHENGKWAEEARIRIENFALDGTASGPARPAFESPAGSPVAAASAPPPGTAAPSTQPTAAAGSARPPAQPVSAAGVGTASAATAGTAQVSTGEFGIQLGAFSTREAALSQWKRLQSKYDAELHGLFARAVPVNQSSDTLYRLQAPVGEESRARALCESLARKSQPCVIVLPRPR